MNRFLKEVQLFPSGDDALRRHRSTAERMKPGLREVELLANEICFE